MDAYNTSITKLETQYFERCAKLVTELSFWSIIFSVENEIHCLAEPAVCVERCLFLYAHMYVL